MVPKDASANEPNQPRDHQESEAELAPIDFSTFVLSLGSSAMVNLGKLSADGESPAVNRPAAKQIIDILGILEQKTSGNLDQSESKLLKSLLHDLRVQYIQCK